MRALSLVVAAVLALLAAPSVRAEDPALAQQRLAELHLQLKTGLDSLGKAVADLRTVPPPKDLPERLGKLLKELPPQLTEYRDVRVRVKAPDDGGLADKLAAGLKSAEELSKAYWAGAGPAKNFPDDVKGLQTQLAALIGETERRVPALSAQTRLDGRLPPAAENASHAATPSAGLRTGSALAACVNSFDGKGCGGSAVGGPSASDDSATASRRAAGASGPGELPSARSSADRSVAGAQVAASLPASVADSPKPSLASGGKTRLDAAAVPAPGARPAVAAAPLPAAGAPKAAAAAPESAAAPKAEPLSPASQACVAAVNGPDPANPQHTTLADMCKTSPNMAPILAGLLDSVKEQFGTVTGIVSNLIFLLLGLLMSVATGGVALILKLLALIGAGWAIWKLVSGLVSAFADSRSAPAGSAERADALKKIGMLGGSLLIMITMALVGFGIGKTKPGAAAVKSMEGGLTAAMDKIGLTSAMEGLNRRLPAPLVAMLEKVVGKAPERVKATEEKPIVPPGEEPLAGAAPAVARAARSSGVTAEVAALIKSQTREQVANQMRTILTESLGKSDGKVTGAQFNAMLGRLTEYARESKYPLAEGADAGPGAGFVARFLESIKKSGPKEGGINVSRKWGLKGVYPKGMTEIKYKGFGFVENEAAEVSGAELHELAHLFHTIQMRATLIRSGVPEASAAKFIALMEDGNNYNNLEYFATQIGKPVAGGTGAGRFQTLANQLIDATETGMRIAEIRLPAGVSVEKGYAYWATRIVPRLLGKSPAEAAVRVTFGTFVAYYIVNVDLRALPGFGDVSPAKLEALGVPKGKSGLRDVVNATITNAPESLVAALR